MNKLFSLKQPKFWYQKNIISYALFPLSYGYRLIVFLRKFYYLLITRVQFPVPIIVVGNLTVGGTGKTPLVIYLAELLKREGFSPGIISRGYGGKSDTYPVLVTRASKVNEVGDEALLIARNVACPLVISPKRVDAVQALLQQHNCDVVISDDGLQHYALWRDIEIVVFDAKQQFGNGFCLPAGPLREPLKKLQQVDFVIKNLNTSVAIHDENSMIIEPLYFYNVQSLKTKKAEEFLGKTVHAVAGIGNPDKFFQTLRQMGLQIIEHAFPDHHHFCLDDFSFKDEIIVMTEKDAVKCDTMAGGNFWYLKIGAKLDKNFDAKLCEKIRKLQRDQRSEISHK